MYTGSFSFLLKPARRCMVITRRNTYFTGYQALTLVPFFGIPCIIYINSFVQMFPLELENKFNLSSSGNILHGNTEVVDVVYLICSLIV